MTRLLSKLRDKRTKGDDGFTLVELLVVVVILGVLIAVAIPLYLNYRKGANDSAAQSDLRNAISVMEVCNTTTGAYPLSVSAAAPVACAGQSISTSSGTTLSYISTAAGVSYVIGAANSGGTAGKYYCYNSSKGGSVASVTAPTSNVVKIDSC